MFTIERKPKMTYLPTLAIIYILCEIIVKIWNPLKTITKCCSCSFSVITCKFLCKQEWITNEHFFLWHGVTFVMYLCVKCILICLLTMWPEFRMSNSCTYILKQNLYFFVLTLLFCLIQAVLSILGRYRYLLVWSQLCNFCIM